MNDNFFITGGTLPPDADSYIIRHADEELLDGLRRGEFCYVLNTRQMGKSSLMARAAHQLQAEGGGVVVLDLTAVGQNLSVEQWYAGLLARVGQQTQQEDELLDYWRAHRELGPMQRFIESLRLLLAPPDASASPPRNFVIFVDEIDAVRSLSFSADEFFAGLRECYNRRAHDPDFNRLTFCLLGVATPSDLIQDTRISPFNIGRRIELRDFTHDEAAPLARGLHHAYASRLLQRILYWTGGHPYLTQRLCRAVMEDLTHKAEGQKQKEKTDEIENMALVDHACERLFLSRAAQETDDNLTFVRSRLLRGETDAASLLDLYLQILKGQRIRDDETNPLCSVLRLSGITTAKRGLLRPRNRIYNHVFDRAWALANMPDAEARRQKRAYRRGLLRAASVFGSAATLAAILLSVAVVNAARARDSAARARIAEKQAEMQGRRADAQAEEARRLLYFSDLRLIQSEWENSNLEHVQSLLDETRLNSQRGWEWNYWNQMAHRPALTIVHEVRATTTRFSPDNHLAILTTVYDIHTGASHYYRGGGWTGGQPVDYAPDGLRLWNCWDDGIQDAFTGQVVLHAERSKAPIITVCALRDSTGLLTITSDGTLCLWSLPALKRVWRQPPRTLIDSTPLIVGCAHVLARDKQKQWHLYRLRDGQENHAFDPALKLFAPSALAFSHDDALLAGEGRNGGIVLLDLRTGRISLPLGAEQTLQAIRFGPEDKTVVAAFWGSVQAWDWHASRERSVFKVNRGELNSYAISPDGRYAATGDKDSEKVWDLNAPVEPRVFDASIQALWHTSYSPDGGTVAAAGEDGSVYRYEALTGLGLPVLRGDGVHVNMAAYSHNGKWIAVSRNDGCVWVWDAQTGRRLTALRAHTRRGETVCFSRDDRTLLTASDDGFAKVWNVSADGQTNGGGSSWRCVLRLTLRGHSKAVESAVFSPDETRILTGSDDHSAKLWDAQSGKLLDTFETQNEIWSAVFSPDGRRIALATLSNTAEVWDIAAHSRVLVLQGHTNWVTDIAFSPDGRRIVTGSRDGTARLWDALSGRELLALKGHQGQVSGVAFSPNGNQIATGGTDGTLRLWNAAPLPDTPAADTAHR